MLRLATMGVSDDFYDYDDDGEEEDPAVTAARAAEHAASLAAAAKAEADAKVEADAIIGAALQVHARDAQQGERMLVDALHAIEGDMGLHRQAIRARPLMKALFELATATAIDTALAYAVAIRMPDDTTYSEPAETALFERLIVRLPSWDASQVRGIIWNLIHPLLLRKRSDEVVLRLLCALIDNARVTWIDREHMVREILKRIDVDDWLYQYTTTPEMLARYRAALAARMGDEELAPEPFARALLLGDPAEAYLELAERYRTRERWRKAIADNINGKADPRFIDEAVRVASIDPSSATRTLGKMRTPRAIEELLHWADTAGAGGAFDILTRYAIHALGEARATEATPAIIRWIERRDIEDVAAILFQSLSLTARREHLPLIDERISAGAEHAARYAELAASIRRHPL